MRTLALLCFLCVPISLLAGNWPSDRIIYVSTSGSDSNDGLSWETAKGTLEGANAALPDGGHIFVAPGQYSIVSQVNFSKPTAVYCSPHQTSFYSKVQAGAAILFSFGNGDPNSNASGAGLYGCTLIGPGSNYPQSIGIQLGAGNDYPTGAYAATLENVTVGLVNQTATGFGTGIQYTGYAFLTHIINTGVFDCNVGINMSMENNSIEGGSISGNNIGLVQSGPTDSYLNNVSFDANSQLAISQVSGILTCTGCHFENPGLGTANYIQDNAGTLVLLGGSFADDSPNGSNPWMIDISNGGSITTIGTSVYSSGRITSDLIHASGVGSAFLSFQYAGFSQPGTRIVNEITPGGLSGFVTSLPTSSPGGPVLPVKLPALEVTGDVTIDGKLNMPSSQTAQSASAAPSSVEPRRRSAYLLVQSPEAAALYSGSITLDAGGAAWGYASRVVRSDWRGVSVSTHRNRPFCTWPVCSRKDFRQSLQDCRRRSADGSFLASHGRKAGCPGVCLSPQPGKIDRSSWVQALKRIGRSAGERVMV